MFNRKEKVEMNKLQSMATDLFGLSLDFVSPPMTSWNISKFL